MALSHLLDDLLRDPTPISFAHARTIASAEGIRSAVADGRLTRVLPDLYASSVHAASWFTRTRASLAFAPGSALSATTALTVWGGWPQQKEICIAAPWTDRPRRTSWLKVRRFVEMPPVEMVGGLRVLDPAMAVVTAHEQLPAGSRAEAVYSPVRQGIVTADMLSAALQGGYRIRARPELIRRIASAGTGAESFLEEEGAARVLTGREFSRIIRQHVVTVQRQLYRLDALDPLLLLNLEFDGARTHGTPEGRRKDAVRDLLLASIGMLTVRFTFREVMDRPEWCRDRVLEVMRTRADQLGVSSTVTDCPGPGGSSRSPSLVVPN